MPHICKICSQGVSSDSVECGKCSREFHLACVNIRPDDVSYLNESHESWSCGDCGKRRILRSNSASSSSKPRGLNEPLTVEHFNKIMSSIQAVSADIVEIKTTQLKLQTELAQVNSVLVEHSGIISTHSRLVAKCQADLESQSVVVTGCRAAVDDLRISYDSVSKQVEEVHKLLSSRSSSGGQPIPSSSANLPGTDSDEKIRNAHNLLIYSLPEGPDDETRVKAVTDLIVPNSSQSILTVSRIRSSVKHADKPRIIRVTFNNLILPKALLRNKAALLSSPFGNVTLRDDKTQRELRLLDSLRRQLKTRQDAGELNLTIKYVRGQPAIVSIPPKN